MSLKIRLCIVYNHALPTTIDLVRQWYSHVDDVCIVTPPGGGGDIEYYTGSYLWQAAIVEYLKARPSSDGGATLVIGDDLLLRPGIALDDVVGPNSEATFAHHRVQAVEPSRRNWAWFPRTVRTWLEPGNLLWGNGEMHPRDVMRGSETYQRNRTAIESMPSSVIHDSERGECDLGVPLFFGYSDLLAFPNAMADEVADFLARTVRVNLFVEIAIPTLIGWSGLPVHELQEHLEVLWGTDREKLEFTSHEQITAYFEEQPHIVGAHPIKLSALVDGA